MLPDLGWSSISIYNHIFYSHILYREWQGILRLEIQYSIQDLLLGLYVLIVLQFLQGKSCIENMRNNYDEI